MKLWFTTKMTRIYRLELSRCNCYLITKDGCHILVDTGVLIDRKRLVKQLDKLGIHKLDAILITHVHTDHVENAEYFSKQYKAKVYVHPLEQEQLINGRCIMPNGTGLWTKLISGVLHKTKLYSSFTPVGNSEAYPLKEQKNITYATLKRKGEAKDLDLLVLETKGHTTGSVSVIVDHEVAIVGDAMVHSLVGSIYPPFGEDDTEILASWRKLLNTKCKVYCPAHGREVKRRLLWESLSVYKQKAEK
ncbi:MAG: MBL fold metallo-hydrolase [bacterium]|nr:MBL fold metallo-hydrolase [bacterium]